jgi:hypothetical protein
VSTMYPLSFVVEFRWLTCHWPPGRSERWIYSYFRTIDLNQTGAAAFQRQLYFCMFGQALFLKAQVESWRATNIFGLLLWQYHLRHISIRAGTQN